MGTRRNTPIAVQHQEGLSAPLKQEVFWKKVHRKDAFLKQGRRCKYCLEPMLLKDATADHRLAKRKGGTTTSKNIAAACEACNSAKGHMTEHAFGIAIRRPGPHHRWGIWLAWSRRRIWSRCQKAERRILGLVGLAA